MGSNDKTEDNIEETKISWRSHEDYGDESHFGNKK
jgi:hypothetical protein